MNEDYYLNVSDEVITQQKFICRFINKPRYLQHYTLQKFGNNLLMTYIPFLNIYTRKTFSITSTKDKESNSNGELTFLDTLLKHNNGKISVLVHRKPTHTDQCLYYKLSLPNNLQEKHCFLLV